MEKTITESQNIAQEAIGVHEQPTRFPGIIGMDFQDFMDPLNQCPAIARSKEISYIHSKILSYENKTGIISPGKGATV
jgi:hypothetical protein